MNMERAKTIIIIFLVILNVALGTLIFLDNREYMLTSQQENAIRTVLDMNQIILYTFPLVDYKPLKQLRVTPYNFEVDEALELFFGRADEVVTVEQYGDLTYYRGNMSLSVDANTVRFENQDGSGETELEERNVYELCEEFIKKLPVQNINFVLNQHASTRSTLQWVVDYRAQYNGQTIYSSFIRFTITEKGIVRVHCSLSTVVGFVGDSRQIYSPDEALFQLIYQLKSDYGNELITILQMDRVYVIDDKSLEGGNFADTTPYYLFYVRAGVSGQIRNEPYLINAYNNTFLN